MISCFWRQRECWDPKKAAETEWTFGHSTKQPESSTVHAPPMNPEEVEAKLFYDRQLPRLYKQPGRWTCARTRHCLHMKRHGNALYFHHRVTKVKLLRLICAQGRASTTFSVDSLGSIGRWAVSPMRIIRVAEKEMCLKRHWKSSETLLNRYPSEGTQKEKKGNNTNTKTIGPERANLETRTQSLRQTGKLPEQMVEMCNRWPSLNLVTMTNLKS